MKYREFVEKTRELSYLKIPTIEALSGERRTLKNQLVLWQRQGRVHRLKNGVYALNDHDRRAPLSPLMISNILYAPSYISLETALSFFGLIPERVVAVTAVSPKKTAIFENFYGTFDYRSLRKGSFFGFESVEDQGLPVLMATPEKAILDKIYFDPVFRPEDGYFLENLRLQNFESLRLQRLLDYSRRFGSKKVKEGAVVLASLVRREKK